MKTKDIINILKVNKYTFELKENQIIIRLAIKYFLKLYIEDDNIVKYEDVLKTFSLWTNGKRLKAFAKTNIITYLIFILLIALWYIIDLYFFYSKGGKVFIIGIAVAILSSLLEFWYYNKRLSKIKKLLNLNDWLAD